MKNHQIAVDVIFNFSSIKRKRSQRISQNLKMTRSSRSFQEFHVLTPKTFTKPLRVTLTAWQHIQWRLPNQKANITF
jgi:hypothetical protein